MRKLFLLPLLAMLCSPALATDFYIVDLDMDGPAATVTLMDPASVKPGDAGHKLVTFARIYEYQAWLERRVELDCSAPRWRELTRITHDGGGGASTPSAVGDWVDLGPGTVGGAMRDTACAFPQTLPSADSLFKADNLDDAIRRASATLAVMAEEQEDEEDKAAEAPGK